MCNQKVEVSYKYRIYIKSFLFWDVCQGRRRALLRPVPLRQRVGSQSKEPARGGETVCDVTSSIKMWQYEWQSFMQGEKSMMSSALFWISGRRGPSPQYWINENMCVFSTLNDTQWPNRKHKLNLISNMAWLIQPIHLKGAMEDSNIMFRKIV